MAALFLRNLHPGVAEWMIAERFSPAGHVESVHICRDRKTGASLGYAYVNFRHRHQAERVLEMFNFEPLLDRPMHIMWSDREPAAKRTIQSAAAAIERRNGMMLNDREVTIKAEDRPSSQHHASNLFIKNLNSTIDDECLRMVFGQFGRVTSVKVITENRRSKGFGFVSFTSSQEADPCGRGSAKRLALYIRRLRSCLALSSPSPPQH
ncbi:polyadenylate-binding protein 1-like [Hemibagrus wyckioides]|uniref:polyadenylate-binding protein 1-like n=1 Tax=Hemibagrus wyckioides TaxID=337641 RepID=UPI00266D918E|nr:polyadenylate-binding protein 1-like [Hemibagrus wyckioides]